MRNDLYNDLFGDEDEVFNAAVEAAADFDDDSFWDSED